MQEKKWHAVFTEQALADWGSSVNGLSSEAAEARLKKFGANELKEKKKKPLWKLFLRQFASFLVIILVLATIFSFLIGETIDAMVIAAIVVANALLGFWQESKAEKAMDALKKMAAPKAKVIRNSLLQIIDSKNLVPGDIIVLEQGEIVPADARLIEAINLRIDESSLTGESVPAEKNSEILQEKTVLPDRKNIVFMNTIASFGRGKAVVVATGMQTEFGKIAETMQAIEEQETPLAKRLDEFGKKLGIIIIAIAVLLLLLISAKSGFNYDAVLVSISLAVAAIPEGLPVIVTITLALGMRAMARQNAIMRKATAVETLGCTTVICSDKTGTLTRNEMNIRKIITLESNFEFSGNGFETTGKIVQNGKVLDKLGIAEQKALALLLKDAVLCNTAELASLIGDTTELALLVAAKKSGIEKKDFSGEKLLAELPFDSERKRMSVVFENDKKERFAYCKGSAESVLAKCKYVFSGGKQKELSAKEKEKILQQNNELAASGLRVLGFALRKIDLTEKDFSFASVEQNLVFLGLAGMIDSARKESAEAIALAKQAGIKVKMITGDHKLTAIAVAREIGLIESENEAITGIELDELSDSELSERIENLKVFARVSPEHKVRIVEALQKRNEVVAMTGDGVNDALALKKADIGISMGLTGTDIAKQASSMILADDNFATIIVAVREGRKVFANIKNFVRYLLSANIGEIMIVSFAVFAGFPLPLLPIQILWMNLVTDGLPALALGKEQFDVELMKRPPRKKNENIIGEMLPFIIITGIVATIVVLAAFLTANPFLESELAKARTMAFATLIVFELVLVFNCRNETKSAWQLGFFSNKTLVLAVLCALALTIIAVQIPFFEPIFKTTALSLNDWLVVFALSLPALATKTLAETALKAKKRLCQKPQITA